MYVCMYVGVFLANMGDNIRRRRFVHIRWRILSRCIRGVFREFLYPTAAASSSVTASHTSCSGSIAMASSLWTSSGVRMKPLFIGVQVAVFLSVVIFSYFLGAPLYSQIVDRYASFPGSNPDLSGTSNLCFFCVPLCGSPSSGGRICLAQSLFFFCGAILVLCYPCYLPFEDNCRNIAAFWYTANSCYCPFEDNCATLLRICTIYRQFYTTQSRMFSYSDLSFAFWNTSWFDVVHFPHQIDEWILTFFKFVFLVGSMVKDKSCFISQFWMITISVI
jgi:hypothetical protein